MLIAGLILLGLAYWKKQRIIPTAAELSRLAASGIFLWLGGNGLVIWAEQVADSSFTALMVSSAPIAAAVINAVIAHRLPSLRLMGALLLGFGGLGILAAPSMLKGVSLEFYSSLALCCAPVMWAIGSVLQSRHPLELSATASSAYQHLCAFFGFLLAALVLGEPIPHPTTEALMAWSYLVLFGSVLSFTSYISSLRLLPIHIAMTYAYVNPVIALFLGWYFLDEPVTTWTLIGAALVVLGVMGVFRQKNHQQRKEVPKSLCETVNTR
jgi:drug/metabolite transporter (DMT)-like permease